MRDSPVAVAATTAERGIETLLLLPQDARWLYVFAHGAGAGMRHTFMEDVAHALYDGGVATLRFEFPYMTAGSRRPDPAPRLEACVREVVAFAAQAAPGLCICAGGKSMGGRMTSQAQAREPLPGVEALVFTGFPLHPAGAPATKRGDHLDDVTLPMLFLQGDRDALAELHLMREVVQRLGDRATLHVCEGADHGFHVLKRSGRTDEQVVAELASAIKSFLQNF